MYPDRGVYFQAQVGLCTIGRERYASDWLGCTCELCLKIDSSSRTSAPRTEPHITTQVSWIYGRDGSEIQQYRQALYRVAWGAMAFVEHVATDRAGGEEAQVRGGGGGGAED